MSYTIPRTYSEFCPFLHHLITQYSRRGWPILPASGICVLLYFFYGLSTVFYGCIHTCKFSPNKWTTTPDDAEPFWSGTLIFLKLPMAESSSCPFEELELVEILPKEERLWFLFVKLDDELPIGIGTGT